MVKSGVHSERQQTRGPALACKGTVPGFSSYNGLSIHAAHLTQHFRCSYHETACVVLEAAAADWNSGLHPPPLMSQKPTTSNPVTSRDHCNCTASHSSSGSAPAQAHNAVDTNDSVAPDQVALQPTGQTLQTGLLGRAHKHRCHAVRMRKLCGS